MYNNCGLSFRSSFAEGVIDIDWSIPEKFGVWDNDWNFLWKQVKTISLQKPSSQYQPKCTNWSFKWGFAALLVQVGYCKQHPNKCQLRISLMCTQSNLEVWGNLTLKIDKMRTWKPRNIINHCKSENCNDQKDNYKRSYWQRNKILFEKRMNWFAAI